MQRPTRVSKPFYWHAYSAAPDEGAYIAKLNKTMFDAKDVGGIATLRELVMP